jgi:hypothetical protein
LSSESAAEALLPSQESSDVLRILRLSTQFHELRGKFGTSNFNVYNLIIITDCHFLVPWSGMIGPIGGYARGQACHM